MIDRSETAGRPLPSGTRLEPATDLRTRLGGRILIGGAPLTITRLSPAGAELVRRWFAGAPVDDEPKHQALARRLTGSGMAHCRLSEDGHPAASAGPTPGSATMTVIIPVKDDHHGLRSTLDQLLGAEVGPVPSPPAEAAKMTMPELAEAAKVTVTEAAEAAKVTVTEAAEVTVTITELIVVDDGSIRPVAVDRGARQSGPPVTVIRRTRPGGPATARQAGLHEVETPFVAFVDAGVLVAGDDLCRLAATFLDPAVVATAPRVRSIDADDLVARYDSVRSPLDLGPGESLVGPGRQIPYVPTACLVARVDSVTEVGGFDTGLRYGEDVDLVWRLADVGLIRYQPEIEARHPPRRSLTAMVRQRHGYGSAAAPLAARHGDAVAPARMSPWSLLVVALAVAGRPMLAAAAVLGTGLALRPKIRPLPDVTVEALMLTARGHWYAGLSMLTAAVRAWAPFLVLAWLLLPAQRRRLGLAIGAAFSRRLIDGPRNPGAAAVDVGLGAVDDLAYCSGVWTGAFRQRSAQAMAIDMTSWPKAKPKAKS